MIDTRTLSNQALPVAGSFTSDPVVISGLGVFTPLGRSAVQLADAVLAGQCSIAPSRNIDADQLLSNLTSEFAFEDRFDLPESITAYTDRGLWFSVKALNEALTSAGLTAQDLDAKRTAVVVGTSHSGIQHVEKMMKTALAGTDYSSIQPHDFYAALTDHVATVICAQLGLSGLKVTISSACSSSNTAIGYARDLVASGQADRAIVVGTDTLSESIAAGFNSLKVLSKAPAAPFSSPSGITLGEGAGVLILEALSQCQARDHAHRGEILGYALSSDAFHQTSVDDEGRGIEVAIRQALHNAGVGLGDIDYISAHGTGTDSNDVPESQAVARVFGHHVKIASVKSSVGHTLGASGVVELIISLVCAERGYYAPNNHFTEPRSGCAPLDYVHGPQTPTAINTLLCNNYGFGGNNSSLVLSRAAGVYGNQKLRPRPVYISAYGHCVADIDPAQGLQPNHAELSSFVGAVSMPTGNKNSARRSSPSIQFAVKATENAIEQFDLTAVMAEQRYETGIVAGLLHGAQKALEKYMSSVYDDGLAYASSTQFPLTTLNAAAGEVSIKFGIKGFNTTLCGPVGAMKFGFDAVQFAHQERMFDLSSDELTPTILSICDHFNLLARWDGEQVSAGFHLAEGAAVTVLESADAIAARGGRALAEVAAFAVGQDGIGHRLDADRSQLAAVIAKAFADAQVTPDEVDVVIGVGQGTSDFIANEQQALNNIFGTSWPCTTSVAMHYGYAPSAIFPQMVNQAVAILQGAAFYPAITQAPLWRPVATPIQPKVRLVLVVFTSVTFEHSAMLLRAVE
jgi:3-oxoacyl-[acyl-carrier-protein] synthase II